jgi:hypothetical protein
MAHPGGRPSDYTLELVEEICDAISCDSKGLRRLCAENPHWPERRNIYKWLRKHEEFRRLYMQAKESQIEALIDDILDISDEGTNDIIVRTNKDGEEYEVCNNEFVRRSQLRVDSRKWLATKLCPKIYGDKVEKNTSAESQSLLHAIIDKL